MGKLEGASRKRKVPPTAGASSSPTITGAANPTPTIELRSSPGLTPPSRSFVKGGGRSNSCKRLNASRQAYLEKPNKQTNRFTKIKVLKKQERIGALGQLSLPTDCGPVDAEQLEKNLIFFEHDQNATKASNPWLEKDNNREEERPRKKQRRCTKKEKLTFFYNEDLLYIPDTDQGLIVHDNDGTIICIIPPRHISLELLSEKGAINQEHLFQWLRENIQGIQRGESHTFKASHPYVVTGYKARQDSGVSVTLIEAVQAYPEDEENNLEKDDLPQESYDNSDNDLPPQEMLNARQDFSGSPPLLGTTGEVGSCPEDDDSEHDVPPEQTPPTTAPQETPTIARIFGKLNLFYPRRALLRVAHRCEQLIQRFIPTEELSALRRALMVARTNVADALAGYWCSAALGTNFQAAMHVDFDSFFSCLVVSSCLLDESLPFSVRYAANTDYHAAVAHHFIFPTYGIAIPLRPGDHLLFNPLIFHGCSSKLDAYSNSNISLMAFYLKAAVVGGNNADKIKLTQLQQEMLSHISQT